MHSITEDLHCKVLSELPIDTTKFSELLKAFCNSYDILLGNGTIKVHLKHEDEYVANISIVTSTVREFLVARTMNMAELSDLAFARLESLIFAYKHSGRIQSHVTSGLQSSFGT